VKSKGLLEYIKKCTVLNSTSRKSPIVLFGWLPLSFKVPQEKQKKINIACGLYRQKNAI